MGKLTTKFERFQPLTLHFVNFHLLENITITGDAWITYLISDICTHVLYVYVEL